MTWVHVRSHSTHLKYRFAPISKHLPVTGHSNFDTFFFFAVPSFPILAPVAQEVWRRNSLSMPLTRSLSGSAVSIERTVYGHPSASLVCDATKQLRTFCVHLSAKMGHQRRPYTQGKTTTIHVIFTWTRKQWFAGRKGWLSCGQNSAIHMILKAHSLGLQQRSAKVIEVTTDAINRTSAAALSETPRCLHRRKLHNTPTCVDTWWDLLPLQLCSPCVDDHQLNDEDVDKVGEFGTCCVLRELLSMEPEFGCLHMTENMGHATKIHVAK